MQYSGKRWWVTAFERSVGDRVNLLLRLDCRRMRTGQERGGRFDILTIIVANLIILEIGRTPPSS